MKVFGTTIMIIQLLIVDTKIRKEFGITQKNILEIEFLMIRIQQKV